MHFIVDTNDNKKFLYQLQKEIGGTLINDTYIFPENVAIGTLKLVTLLGDVQVLLSHYETRTAITWQKLTTLPEMFTLRFNYIQNSKQITVVMDDSTIKDASNNYAAALLTTSKLPLMYTTEADTLVNTVNINFTPEILGSYFYNIDIKKYLLQIFIKKLALYNYVPLNFSAREALLEAVHLPANSPFYVLLLRTRLFEITDYFWRQYFQKTEELIEPNNEKLQKELEALSELDIAITKNFEADLPIIEELAKSVFMSTTKFQKLFKQLYGQSFYDYYNTSKLNKARKEIIQGVDSIKAIALKYGYKDISNFSIAFKNCFHFSPSTLKVL